jgi:hypothetical protein
VNKDLDAEYGKKIDLLLSDIQVPETPNLNPEP